MASPTADPPLVKNALGADQSVATLFMAIFSIGIAIGSVAVNRLLKGQVSARYSPASVIVMEGEEVIVPPHEEAFALNQIGTGYYPDRKLAVDQPLPQLEDPEQLIQSPKDHPEPVCFAPYSLGGGLL